jgi:8-oxo-dGTP pyrophosphatase MutT (NUDIX family)
MKGTEQVAAVCYRVRRGQIEFLLVNTRGGRWIFPKGAIESGLSHAQAAALEAFEEAGVHGRMQETAFARYIHRKGNANRKSAKELVVRTHLCQVTRLDRPKESHRKPTWFPVQKARERLRDRRSKDGAVELLQVLDLAIARVPQFEQHLSRLEIGPEFQSPADSARRPLIELPFRQRGLRVIEGKPAARLRLLRPPLLKSGPPTRRENQRTIESV